MRLNDRPRRDSNIYKESTCETVAYRAILMYMYNFVMTVPSLPDKRRKCLESRNRSIAYQLVSFYDEINFTTYSIRPRCKI